MKRKMIFAGATESVKIDIPLNYGQIEDFKKAPATATPEIIVELCETLQGYMTGAITRKSLEQTMDELYTKRYGAPTGEPAGDGVELTSIKQAWPMDDS